MIKPASVALFLTILLTGMIAAILTMTATADSPRSKVPDRVGNWSVAVDGVRARLIMQWPNSKAAGRVAIEFRNETENAVAIRVPPSFSARVLDYNGNEIVPTHRVPAVPRAEWGVVPARSYLGVLIEPDSQDKVRRTVVVDGMTWNLEPDGYYELWLSLDPPLDSEAPVNAWTGFMTIPPLRLVVD